jgi:hypothetical protein
VITLNNTTITTSGQSGTGIHSENTSFVPPVITPSTVEADKTVIMTSGADAVGAFAVNGGTINLNGSTVTTNGPRFLNTDGATGVYALGGAVNDKFFGSTINVSDSTVTTKEGSAAQVVNGSTLNVTDSTLNGGTNGIRITDNDHTNFGPDNVTVTNSHVNAVAAGVNEAAFRVDGALANVTLNSVTDSPGANNLFLNVIALDKSGKPFNSIINLFSNSSTLSGDILADSNSTANVSLEHSSTLNGWVNKNNLTGATHLDPNELIPPTVIPPQSVNLGIDSTSTWNMRAGSTLNSLTVNPQAHINFPDPPAAFRTLVMNNLVGTGGIFGMNVDLGLIQGDLMYILKTSEGQHLVTFVNRNQGSDLPVNVALLVVRTSDGGAGFRGEADGGTFRYFVVHGDGSSVTPVRNDWYLVRGDEINPPKLRRLPLPIQIPRDR